MNLKHAKVTWLRKHFIGFHSKDAVAIAAAHEGPLSGLLEECAGGWADEIMIDGDALLVPREEFSALITDLPEFKTLPIMWSRWNALGKPTEFVVKCFETEDELAVDTQGYDYARYKSAIKWV